MATNEYQSYMCKMERQYMPMMVKAKGIRYWDEQNREYIDFSGMPLACTLGYGNEQMIQAITEQLENMSFCYRYVGDNKIVNAAGKKVCDFSGGTFTNTFFVSGGSEASEAAMAFAAQYHIANGEASKYKVIGRWQSFHGMTKGAVSLSGHVGRRKHLWHFYNEMGHITPPYCYRCWYGKNSETCNLECANALEDEILMQDPETVAAFIAEPVSGSSIAGAIPPKKYFKRIREICDKYNVLLIFDEILCGCGRTGYNFNQDYLDIKPDISVLGKALGGGYYPVGAAALTKKVWTPIFEKLKNLGSGSTWCMSVVNAAVITKTLDIYEKEGLVDKVRKDGDYLLKELKSMAQRHPTIGDVRGKGLVIGVEFVKDKESKKCFDTDTNFSQRLTERSRDKGLLLSVMQGCNRFIEGDAALIGPHYITAQSDYEKALEIFDGSLTQLEKDLGY